MAITIKYSHLIASWEQWHWEVELHFFQIKQDSIPKEKVTDSRNELYDNILTMYNALHSCCRILF